MESSEEGTPRLPFRSDVAGPLEHRAMSQEEHRLPPDPGVEWRPGKTVTLGLGWEHVHTRHTQACMRQRQSIYPKSWVSLIRGWALHPRLLVRVCSPRHIWTLQKPNGELGVLHPPRFLPLDRISRVRKVTFDRPAAAGTAMAIHPWTASHVDSSSRQWEFGEDTVHRQPLSTPFGSTIL